MDFLNALVVFSNFVFIPALAYGSQLALGALGVTLIYGILRFSNFAHGDTMAFGAMITVLGTWWLQSIGVGLGPLPTALIALPIGIIFCSLFMFLLMSLLIAIKGKSRLFQYLIQVIERSHLFKIRCKLFLQYLR